MTPFTDPLDPAKLRGRAARYPLSVVFLILVVAGMAAMALDVPLARWVNRRGIPGTLRDLIEHAEVFGNGITVAVILLAVYLLDSGRRWAMPRMIVMVIGAGLVANLAKLLLERTRPSAFDYDLGVWQSFGGWLPLGGNPWAAQSFASAHTATAVALAVGLSILYPSGRWLFFSLAALAGLQRVKANAHFVSDVCWGGAIGWLFAVSVARGMLGGRTLVRWEEWLWSRIRSTGQTLGTAVGSESGHTADVPPKKAAA